MRFVIFFRQVKSKMKSKTAAASLLLQQEPLYVDISYPDQRQKVRRNVRSRIGMFLKQRKTTLDDVPMVKCPSSQDISVQKYELLKLTHTMKNG